MTATLTYGDVTKTVLLDKIEAGGDGRVAVDRARTGAMIEPVDAAFRRGPQARRMPASGRTGSSSDVVQVLGEATEIEPRDLFSLEAIPVLTLPNFPFDRYPQVDVQLRYDDPAHGIRQDDVVRLTKEQPNATWQRFLVGAPAAPIMAKITYRAADHRDRDMPFAPLAAPQVDIPDPVPAAAQGDRRAGAQLQRGRSRVRRSRSTTIRPNGVHVEDSIEVAQNQPVPPFIVDRVDPTLSRVRYKISDPDEGLDAVRGAVVDDAREPDLRASRSQGASRGDAARAGGLRRAGSGAHHHRGAREGRDRRALVRRPLRLSRAGRHRHLRVRLRRSGERRLSSSR